MADSSRQSVLFPELVFKPVLVAFDQPSTTLDGGAVLLRVLDESLGSCSSLVSCLTDSRQAGKVDHSLLMMFRQRVFSIGCGYADCNDAGRLQGDPAHHLLLQEGATRCAELASQPTLSRFENSAGQTGQYRLGRALAEAVVERHRKRLGARKVKKITIDLDGSVDPTHGT